MDFTAAGLLDGLEGEERAARERLLQRLRSDGFALDELKAAVDENRLALLPVERVLGGRYTASEVEELSGVPTGLMVRIRTLLGLPKPGSEDRVFGDEDVAAAKSAQQFLDSGLGEETISEITRVLGEAMARVAATTTAGFAGAFLESGDSELDVAQRFESLSQQLTPAFREVLVAAYQAHLRDSVRRGFISRAELETGHLPDAQEVTVCFADLVGYTRLGSEVEAPELGSVARRLSELAVEVADDPVRLVKTIGDAAMFVSREPAPLVAAALSLIEAVEAEQLPALRAGIALGPTLLRGGDFYGHSVNLASRVTGEARPGSVLCTEEVRDAALEDFEWSFARRHRLKGISEAVPLYRVRWRKEAEADRASGKGSDRKPRRRRRSG